MTSHEDDATVAAEARCSVVEPVWSEGLMAEKHGSEAQKSLSFLCFEGEDLTQTVH